MIKIKVHVPSLNIPCMINVPKPLPVVIVRELSTALRAMIIRIFLEISLAISVTASAPDSEIVEAATDALLLNKLIIGHTTGPKAPFVAPTSVPTTIFYGH